MSKNYEVLLQAGKVDEIFHPSYGSKPDHAGGEVRVSDEILKLIHRTFLNGTTPASRLVVFTSVEHRSGCSWVCAHVAETLASLVNGAVCVVDANLQAPALYRYFGMSNAKTSSELIMETGPIREYARAINGGNLYLMSGNAFTLNGSGVVNSERLRSRFLKLCTEFSYVLIDAPPVNDGAASLVLGQISDGVVLVLEAKSTRREAARRAKESLESARVKVLGAVLNKRTFPIPQGLYNKF